MLPTDQDGPQNRPIRCPFNAPLFWARRINLLMNRLPATRRTPTNANAPACTILAWNIQEAGSPGFLNMPKEHIRMQPPNILALVETHISGPKAQAVCDKIGFEGCFRVEAQGFQGRILDTLVAQRDWY